jgi:hypothetical protein
VLRHKIPPGKFQDVSPIRPFPLPFQFIIHQLYCHSMLHSLDTNSTVK